MIVCHARGSSFARHLLMLERPDRLRLEILGLVGQRVAVLASDGVSFDLYRAETGRVERGPVYPELLGEKLERLRRELQAR